MTKPSIIFRESLSGGADEMLGQYLELPWNERLQQSLGLQLIEI